MTFLKQPVNTNSERCDIFCRVLCDPLCRGKMW